jgi:alpha-L-arabinofuranosidase
VKAVNNDLQHGLTLEIHVDGAVLAPQAELDSLTAASVDAENTFTNSAVVSVRSSSLRFEDHLAVELPGDSVSIITLHVIPAK